MAASSSLGSEFVGEVLLRTGEDSSPDDIWDDTALIEAYDRAVNLVKNGNFKNDRGSKGKGGGKNRKQQSAKGNGNKKKEKRRVQQNSDSSEQWQVGDSCTAEFTEDGDIYEATIVSINREKQTCIVKYDNYGNQEEQKLKHLLQSQKSEQLPDQGYYTVDSPHYQHREHAETDMEWVSQTPSHSAGEWRVSDICLAPEHPSGHWHEAVINSFPTAYTCHVTFIRSRKSQQVDRSQLCQTREHQQHHPPGQHYPSRPPLPVHQNIPWPPPPPMSNFPFHHPSFPSLPNSIFPPGIMPMCGHMNQHPPAPPIPPVPPHPLTNPSGQDNEALASMLMSWYLSGYYTGYYQGLQRTQPPQSDGSQTQPDTTNTSINCTHQTSTSVAQNSKQSEIN